MTKAKYSPLKASFDMAKLVCADYGYDCAFEVEGDSNDVAEKFRVHSEAVSYTHLRAHET